MAAASHGDHKYADDLPYGAAVGSPRRGLGDPMRCTVPVVTNHGILTRNWRSCMSCLGKAAHALLSLSIPCRDAGGVRGDNIYKEMKNIYVCMYDMI